MPIGNTKRQGAVSNMFSLYSYSVDGSRLLLATVTQAQAQGYLRCSLYEEVLLRFPLLGIRNQCAVSRASHIIRLASPGTLSSSGNLDVGCSKWCSISSLCRLFWENRPTSSERESVVGVCDDTSSTRMHAPVNVCGS